MLCGSERLHDQTSRRPAERKLVGRKPARRRPFRRRPVGHRPVVCRPARRKLVGRGPFGCEPARRESVEQRYDSVFARRTADESHLRRVLQTNCEPVARKPARRRPAGRKLVGHRPARRRPFGCKPVGRRPDALRPDGSEPDRSEPDGRTLVGGKPSWRKLVGRRPDERKPIKRKPIKRKPDVDNYARRNKTRLANDVAIKRSTGRLPCHPTPYICINCCANVWFCVIGIACSCEKDCCPADIFASCNI